MTWANNLPNSELFPAWCAFWIFPCSDRRLCSSRCRLRSPRRSCASEKAGSCLKSVLGIGNDAKCIDDNVRLHHEGGGGGGATNSAEGLLSQETTTPPTDASTSLIGSFTVLSLRKLLFSNIRPDKSIAAGIANRTWLPTCEFMLGGADSLRANYVKPMIVLIIS